MRVIRINRNRVTKRALDAAAAVLQAGGVVAFPTETAYGLAADPASKASVRRVYAIKGRAEKMPLPLIVATAHDAMLAFAFSVAEMALAQKYWPGPLTVVCRPRRSARIVSTSPDGTVAVRLPKSAWARAIADAAGGLATSTSANISGTPSLYSGRAVAAAFRGRAVQPDLLLDAGTLPKRAPSTIVRLRGKKVEVLRQGAIRIG